MVAVDWKATCCVATENAKLVDPAGTVTDAGTVTALTLEDRRTDSPPEGAAALRRTVPFADWPPVRLLGDTEIPWRVAAGVTSDDERVTLVVTYTDAPTVLYERTR